MDSRSTPAEGRRRPKDTRLADQQLYPEVLNDRRPDFAANPFNGRPPPTFEEVLRTLCSTAPGPSCVRREITPNNSLASPTAQIPDSYQTSIGVQRQLGDTTAVEADYVFTGSRHERFSRNVNLSYNPATGVNYSFTDISRRPYPDWGVVTMDSMEGRSNYHALQTAFTKRFSHQWQASGTYALSGFWDGTPPPVAAFPVAPDLGGEYTLATSDQRHRAVVNGIWRLGYGFQLSGLYFSAPAPASAPAMAATCAIAGRLQAVACVRMAALCPATTWSGSRSTGWTYGSSGGLGSAAARGSMASWKCSTCSTMRTTGPT